MGFSHRMPWAAGIRVEQLRSQLFNRRSRNGATGRLFAALQEKRINGAESQPHQTFCFLFPAFVPCPMRLGSMGVPASSAAPRIPVG